jgi:NADH-quinone oxidoreductase subunit M
MRDLLLSVGYDRWILPVLLIVPVLAALIVWVGAAAMESGTEVRGGAAARFARWVTLLAFLTEFVLSVGLWWSFDPTLDGWQSLVSVPWITTWHVNFTLGIDGIAVVLILLTTLLMPLTVMGSWTR